MHAHTDHLLPETTQPSLLHTTYQVRTHNTQITTLDKSASHANIAKLPGNRQTHKGGSLRKGQSLIQADYVCVEKVTGKGEGASRDGHEALDPALRHGRAKQDRRLRHHRGRRDGNSARHLHLEVRAHRGPPPERHEDAEYRQGRRVP
jgi:hypothetical protein